MKRTYVVILIAQFVAIALLVIFSLYQRTMAQAARQVAVMEAERADEKSAIADAEARNAREATARLEDCQRQIRNK